MISQIKLAGIAVQKQAYRLIGRPYLARWGPRPDPGDRANKTSGEEGGCSGNIHWTIQMPIRLRILQRMPKSFLDSLKISVYVRRNVAIHGGPF